MTICGVFSACSRNGIYEIRVPVRTLFLAVTISSKGTRQRYVGRLHRLHDYKQFVQVYAYVSPSIPMLAWMYEPG